MSRLSRTTQSIFASLAGLNQISEFGSLAQGSPTFTTSPTAAQTATWAAGWFAAVLGNNSPAMEDVNALFFVITYQLAYMLQLGVQEWDSATTYYIGSLAQDGTGKVYVSLINSNTNNVLSSAANWQLIAGPIMTALGDLTYGGASAALTKLAGNTTTTKKYLSQTGTGSASAAPSWQPLASPTVQKFTSGSGTYTTPAGVAYIKVRMVGGGGGGAGGGSAGGTAAGSGGNTTFGTTLLVANGGAGGTYAAQSGAGGTASLGSGPIGLALQGGSGGSPTIQGSSAVNSISIAGGMGAATPFGGAGGGGYQGNAGQDAIANTGSGAGGGPALPIIGAANSGGGGSAGGFVDAIIAAPAASYAYSVGASGTAGGAGTLGAAGGAGGSGIIIVEEYYQ